MSGDGAKKAGGVKAMAAGLKGLDLGGIFGGGG